MEYCMSLSAEAKTVMSLDQLIAMLMAARAQGATTAALVRMGPHHLPECAPIDWVSPTPVDGVVYIKPMEDMYDVLGNEAAESVDM